MVITNNIIVAKLMHGANFECCEHYSAVRNTYSNSVDCEHVNT